MLGEKDCTVKNETICNSKHNYIPHSPVLAS